MVDQRPNHLSIQFSGQSGHVSRAAGLEVQRTCENKDFAHSLTRIPLVGFAIPRIIRLIHNFSESDRNKFDGILAFLEEIISLNYHFSNQLS